jgi:hypothetical protein
MATKAKISSAWSTVLAIFLGGILTLSSTVITYLWLIPSQEKKIHQYELAEHKVSRLYQPILIATGYGNFSLTSDVTFHKVRRIMEEFSYLADKEVTDRYIDFLKHCQFMNMAEMLGTMPWSLDLDWVPGKRQLPESVIAEFVRTTHLPLKWTGSKLEKALAVEKEFQKALLKYYAKAYREFLEY